MILNCSAVKNGATAEIVNLVSTYTKINNTVRYLCIDDFERGGGQCHTTAKCLLIGVLPSI